MSQIITWTSGNPDDEANLAQISTWWRSLASQPILWKQRPLPSSGIAAEINWDTDEQFDEEFAPESTDLRGITLYWRKLSPDSLVSTPDQERNLTPYSLTLDTFRQHLYISPSSGRSYQIRVSLPQVTYQTISLNQAQISSLFKANGDAVLLLRDPSQKLEIKLTLSLSDRLDLLAKLQA
ncbi:MAG: hypothetical protein SFT94_02385 [Pseudanabaenaceae cyanobacterium bins.68]|nr:hypothetical protein [Pseudanabaenaceae cyanobacterium bins.68]